MKKSEREKIFNKYGGKCAYCGCDLKKGWHADHISPIVRIKVYDKETRTYKKTSLFGGSEPETSQSFNPACASCNLMKNSFPLEDFRSNIKNFINSLNQYSTQYKFAKKFGLVEEKDVDVVFYFERIEP